MSTRRSRLRSSHFRAVLAIAAMCSAVGESAVGAAAARAENPPLMWSTPVLVDDVPPANRPAGFSDISCPTETLCVAATGLGVVTSTDPFAASPHWQLTRLDPGPTAVSCPSASVCVGVGKKGSVLSSTDPAGGPQAWKSIRLTQQSLDGQGLEDISCPGVSLCVAAGYNHPSLIVSTNPTGDARDWVVQEPGGHLPLSVSCPSSDLCITTSCPMAGLCVGGDYPLTLTDPAGAATWSARPTAASVAGASCPSVTFCAGSTWGGVVFSTNPTGAGDTWQTTKLPSLLPPGEAAPVSCVTPRFCVLVRSQGTMSYSIDPSRGADSWSAWQTLDPGGRGFTVNCTSPSLCAGVDAVGNILTTRDPTGPPSGWSRTNIVLPGVTGISDVNCPTSSLCVAIDGAGRVLTTQHPANPAAGWRVSELPKFARLVAGSVNLLCTALPACVVAGQVPNTRRSSRAQRTGGLTATWALYLSNAPDAGAGAWADVSSISAGPEVCPFAGLCVGHAFGGLTLRTSESKGLIPTRDLSCPTTRLCVGWLQPLALARGQLGVSTRPLGDSTSWRKVLVDPSAAVQQVSCPSTRLCVGYDTSGNVIASTTPTSTKPWKLAPLVPSYTILGLACPSSALCVIATSTGEFFTTTTPGDPGTWRSVADLDRLLTRFSCPTTTLCVAVDDSAHVLVGTGPGVLGETEARNALRPLVETAASDGVDVAGTRLGTCTRESLIAFGCAVDSFEVGYGANGRRDEESYPVAWSRAWLEGDAIRTTTDLALPGPVQRASFALRVARRQRGRFVAFGISASAPGTSHAHASLYLGRATKPAWTGVRVDSLTAGTPLRARLRPPAALLRRARRAHQAVRVIVEVRFTYETGVGQGFFLRRASVAVFRPKT